MKSEHIVTSRNEHGSKSKCEENEHGSKSKFEENEQGSQSKFEENEHGSNSKFGENEHGSNSKFEESFILNCASCNYQIHESQTVYMYNDQCFCCHRCRAKVMSLDRVQAYADCHKEIISSSNTEKPEEHNITTSKNEVGSMSKLRERNIRRCASCDYQMHQSQIVYVYNDQCFCRHRCRAKVMALDRLQTYAATTQTEDCSKDRNFFFFW